MINLQRAVIEVFGGCNYSCKMCPQTTGRGSDWKKKMPLDFFESILDQLPGKPLINLEGSGEPSLLPDLPLYVEACTKRGLKSYMYCNGSKLVGDFAKDVVDAGISLIRFSCIGYDRPTYNHWMNVDNFDLILDNARFLSNYVKESQKDCTIASYHLILDNTKIEEEVNLYRKNFIEKAGTVGYVWKMHNWSGNYKPIYFRNAEKKKSCGRPAAPELTVRAGGNGKLGAVTPCCQTLGPPNESKSVLGHFEDQTFEEIWNGQLYNDLRVKHSENRFDEIDYCKNCDFLYEDPEVLVWSNDNKASIDYMLGTDFSLKDYK
jgi:radical SAM protein with 4Fe4S-binding SPASM domain